MHLLWNWDGDGICPEHERDHLFHESPYQPDHDPKERRYQIDLRPMVACVVQGLALRGVQEDHSFVLTNAGEKENDRVKAIKRMLTGIMLMLMAISFAVGNGDRGTWLGGAAFILLPIAVAVFVVGLFTEEEK